MNDLVAAIDEYIGPESVLTGALWLLLFIGLFLLACLLIRTRQSRMRRYWFTGVNAVLLTAFTIGVASDYPLLLSEQASLMQKLYPFKTFIHQNETIGATLGDNRLWLVDVSHDVSLVANRDMTATWGGQRVITDRRKLTRLLDGLATDPVRNVVDLVVCDLTFSTAADAAQDDLLRKALSRLDSLGKLMIAQSGLADNREIDSSTVVDADTLCGGQVDIPTYFGGAFYAYPLFGVTDQTRRKPSLAYAIYRRLAKGDRCCTGADRASDEWPVMRQFIPDYLVDDSDVVGAGDLSDGLEATAGQLTPYFYRLGQLTAFRVDGDTALSDEFDPEAMAPFVSELSSMHDKGLRNVVFIGIFDGKERDMHQTAIGPMHGSMILINALLNMLTGAHRITWLYVLLLLLGFAGISWQFLHIELGRLQHRETLPPPEKPDPPESMGRTVGRLVAKVLDDSVRWVSEEQVYLLTLGLLLVAVTAFNHLINIAVVELYLGINAFLLKEFWRVEASRAAAISDQSSHPGQA